MHINSVLAGDALVKDRLPFGLDDDSLFDGCKDGLVLRQVKFCSMFRL